MKRLLVAAPLLGAVLACGPAPTSTRTCSLGAYCAGTTALVVTGRLTASLAPLPNAPVALTVYADTCGGAPARVGPSPSTDTTDAAGRYAFAVVAFAPVPAACVRVAYSSALFRDTSGVALSVDPRTADSVQLDLVGP